MNFVVSEEFCRKIDKIKEKRQKILFVLLLKNNNQIQLGKFAQI